MGKFLTEFSNNLETQQYRNSEDRTSKIEHGLKHNDEKKVMSKIMLVHQEHHPKDASRCILQMICRDTRGPVFRDLLGADKAIEACHRTRNLKDLAVSRKMQASMDNKLKGSTCVAKQKGKIVEVLVKDMNKDLVRENGATVGIMNHLSKILVLVGKEVRCNDYSKKLMIKSKSSAGLQ